MRSCYNIVLRILFYLAVLNSCGVIYHDFSLTGSILGWLMVGILHIPYVILQARDAEEQEKRREKLLLELKVDQANIMLDDDVQEIGRDIPTKVLLATLDEEIDILSALDRQLKRAQGQIISIPTPKDDQECLSQQSGIDDSDKLNEDVLTTFWELQRATVYHYNQEFRARSDK